MFKNSLFLLGTAVALILTGSGEVKAQTFDTSGTPAVNGQYLFRYIAYLNDENGNMVESCSMTGSMNFNGAGNYTLSGIQFYDSAGTSLGYCSNLGAGTYGVQSNGMLQMDSPMYQATLYGSISAPVITASSTEDDYFDLFIAVQAPSAAVTNSNLSGSYTVGSIEFPNVATAGNSLTHQAYFTLNANGSGTLASMTLTGSAANLTPVTVTQTVSGATYSASGNGFSVTIPNSNNSQLVSGTKTLFISSDGNYIVGGSTASGDMIFGFRSATSPSNAQLSGTYFASGVDAQVGSSTSFLDAFYGSVNTNGAGTILWHERFDDVVDVATYDSTFNSSVNIGSNGSYFDGTYTTLLGFNGQAALLIGSGSQFSLNIYLHAPNVTPTSSVWINPIGITNAANYTGITNAYAPGELVNIYGNFGVSTQVDTAIPIPTNLSGVQVTVNGVNAPVYLVSANQITVLVPYVISQYYFATFQVIVNGSKSNTVTVYADYSAPGIYTSGQNGIGTSALLHANGSLISDSSPAVPGETVSLYLNGLGTVTPAVGDGAAGPSSPLSYVDEYNEQALSIYLDDFIDAYTQAKVTFAGLAPGIPGLYQINFTLPSKANLPSGNGHVNINVNTNEASSEMSTISLSGYSKSSGVTDVAGRKPGADAMRAKAASIIARRNVTDGRAAGTKTQVTKDKRRALPERIVE